MNLQVKYLDLPKQFKDEVLWASLKGQFETCQFIMGPEVEKFESNFARLCHTVYALGVNSGTDALFLALKALDIGLGDEVITVPNSFVATVGAIIAAGAIPVFVDVRPDYNINVELIEPAITDRTKAILPVHLTGNPADMIKIMEIAKRHNLYAIEDAAQAVTASINGQPVGSFGDIGCFSFHPLKNLNVCGDGGVLTTSSKGIYEKVRMLRNHGLKNRDEIEFFGYNSRLDTIQALVANHVLENLQSITDKRIKNAKLYDDELKEIYDFVTLPPRKENVKQVFHTYVIQVSNRTGLIRYLDEHGVETKIHYPIPLHLQKPCQKLGYKKGDFPVCENQAERILSLPIHQHLTEEQIYYVADLIKKFYRLT
jgi:dTDP-4-amino-4,6-dideoxygalactose transaminase